MFDQETANQIFNRLKSAEKILILAHAHPRPDGDSLGSILALTHYCRSIDKPYTVFATTPIEEALQYLPGLPLLEHDAANIHPEEYDVVVMCDFGEFKRSGLEQQLVQAQAQGALFIHLDHHPLIVPVADITLVNDHASSTAEVIYQLFELAGADVSPDMATCLLAGLITDTQNFTNLGTTAESLRISGELVKRGGRFQEVSDNFVKNKQLATLRLWSKVLSRLQEDPQTGMTTTAVTLEDLAEEGLTHEATEGLSNFLSSLGTARAILVLTEEAGGKVKGSLRTTHDDVDVSLIAKKYGGGGHKKAGGFVVEGRIVKREDGWKVVK